MISPDEFLDSKPNIGVYNTEHDIEEYTREEVVKLLKLHLDLFKSTIVQKLNETIEFCEHQENIFNECNLEVSVISSGAMKQAYKNVLQIFEHNK